MVHVTHQYQKLHSVYNPDHQPRIYTHGNKQRTLRIAQSGKRNDV